MTQALQANISHITTLETFALHSSRDVTSSTSVHHHFRSATFSRVLSGIFRLKGNRLTLSAICTSLLSSTRD
jgi:hypothetical protein